MVQRGDEAVLGGGVLTGESRTHHAELRLSAPTALVHAVELHAVGKGYRLIRARIADVVARTPVAIVRSGSGANWLE